MMFIIILIVILIVYFVWKFGTRNFGYWVERGVKHDKPTFFFGNMYEQTMLQLSLAEQITKWYNRFPGEKYVGVHMGNDLGLVLRDPDLIKHVLVTDFRSFHQRGVHPHKHVREPLFQNLFTADGDVWKLMRQRLTPAFSSGKLKAMFPLIVRTAEKMLSVTQPGSHDVRDLMARYTTDFIGICGFGLDFDSLNDESSMFRKLGKRIFALTNRDAVIQILKRTAPDVFKHVNFFAPEIQENTLHIITNVVKKRNYQPSGRNDFVDLLLELKQKGKIIGESIEHFNSDGTPKTVEFELDDMMIAAQAFIFFAAGFETSSSVSSFLLHELAFNSDVQDRCHKEIDEVLSRYGGQISFESLNELKYLKMALKEALRLHPSPGFLMRRCGKKYSFPGTTLTIDEDVIILVPLQGLHKDPRFFEEPEDFKPERYLADKQDSVPKYVFMPFGEGPRACVGERLGIMQSLAGVTMLLSKFRIKPAPTTRRWPLTDPRSIFVENIIGGLPLSLELRETACLSII